MKSGAGDGRGGDGSLGAHWPRAGEGWFTVIMLSLALLVAFVDRTVMSLLITPIKQDLSLTDTEVGLLVGAAFGLMNAFAAIPCGYIADRFNRRNLIAWGLIVFALATSASSLATSFAMLFLLRALVGVGEATLHPGATSMIADLFPPERRSRPYGFYLMAAASGISLVFLIGGPAVAWLTGLGERTVLGLGPFAPWQMALMVAGVPGLALAIAILAFVREPRRVDTVRLPRPHARVNALGFMTQNWRVLGFQFGGATLLLMTPYSLLAWIVPWFERGFGWGPGQIGVAFALTGGLAAALASPFVGELADRLKRAGVIDANYWICMFGGFACAAFVAIAGSMQSPWLAIVFITLGCLFFTACPIANAACVNEFAPNAVRARLLSIFNLVVAVGANSLGPILVGVFNDHLFAGEWATARSMTLVAATSGVLGLVVMSFGRAAYADTLRGHQRHEMTEAAPPQ